MARFLAMRVDSIVQGVRTIIARDDIRGRLGRIRRPTLVLAGEEDDPQPPPRSRAIAERIAGAGLVIVPRAGHLSAAEAPLAVTREIVGFLDRHYGGSGAAAAA